MSAGARLLGDPSCPFLAAPSLSWCSPQFAHLSLHGANSPFRPLAQDCAWGPLWLLPCLFKLSCPSRRRVSCPRRLWRSRECSGRTCLSLSVSSTASLAARLPDLPSQPAFLFPALTLSPPMVTVSVPSPRVISPGAVFLAPLCWTGPSSSLATAPELGGEVGGSSIMVCDLGWRRRLRWAAV